MTAINLDVLRKLRADQPIFAKSILRIRDKAGNIVPLVYNSAQLLAHEKLERQRRITGMVRALLLKGRQQGISTYTQSRFYHRTSMNKGQRAYILTHEQKASDNIFKIVDLFHRNNPIAPKIGVANVKELEFADLESGYVVATAGQKAGGRGTSTNLFHGSEVAYWPQAADHFAASVQAVPFLPGTEIILESTANGVTGEFYERVMQAVGEIGDYQVIFIPWFLQTEYSRPAPEDFTLTQDSEEGELSEAEYASVFGLTMDQMAWRRSKIAELRSIKLFNQEYPATIDLAFQDSKRSALIAANLVLRARKRKVEAAGPLIMGVDPAGPGGDRFAVAFRRGYVCERVLWRDKLQTAEAHAWLKELIAEHRPDRVFVDAGGIGHAVVSLLRNESSELAALVQGVNFGSPSQKKKAQPNRPGPRNRRAEMWDRMREWFELEVGVSIPDMDVLQADLTAVATKPTLTNDLLLESKDELRKRGVRSPDLGDALALTFASLQPIRGFVGGKKRTAFLESEEDMRKVSQFDSVEIALGDDFDSGPYGWMGV